MRLISALLLLLLTISGSAFGVTNAQVFAYAEANLPSIFTGTAVAGQYQQYSYRFYPASGNYLAVDTSGVIYVLGTFTGGVITAVGPAASYADEIAAWEARPAAVRLVTVNGGCVVSQPCNTSLVGSVTGGAAPYHFQQDSLIYGLRPLNTNIDLLTGNIVGVPSQAGSYTFNLCAVDVGGGQDCGAVTVNVNQSITANPGSVAMTASTCYPSQCTVSQTIRLTSSTPWTSSSPGFGSLGSGFLVSPDTGPAGTTSVTISYTSSVPQPANGFIRFRTTIIGVYAEVPVLVTTR